MKISVSFLVDNPKKMIKEADASICDFLHVDIMDGKFVEKKSFTYNEIKKLVSGTTKKLDVHLMVKSPLKYIEDYALLNAEYITIHYESTENIEEVIQKIKYYGLKVGLSIKPNTDVSSLIPYLSNIDLVLIMSVEPGKSGQEFKESILYKIEVLKKIITERSLNIIISVDGGINDQTAFLVKEKGADMVVSASYLETNTIEKIQNLKNI